MYFKNGWFVNIFLFKLSSEILLNFSQCYPAQLKVIWVVDLLK